MQNNVERSNVLENPLIKKKIRDNKKNQKHSSSFFISLHGLAFWNGDQEGAGPHTP